MGQVHSGEQTSLRREVAVKSLRPELLEGPSALRLVREAWVMAQLEHPGVVPVYDVQRDELGAPWVVQKRVDGVPWSTVLRDDDALKELGEEDPLDFHLRVFLRVCDAIGYAHAAGIIHRDLKPENVMVGRYGEVYVVDWGLAAALEGAEQRHLPRAVDCVEMAGTLAYMAPEMLGGAGHRLGPATDIYLLGSILYELLMGTPPHRGDTLVSVVYAIMTEEPPIDERVPPDLVRVIRRAMSRSPDDRFEDVDALAREVRAFRVGRDAERIADRAVERLAALKREVEAEGAIGPQRRDRRQRLFGEVRFGFRHALSVRPDGARAKEGLAEALELMTRAEIAEGNAESAHALLTAEADVIEVSDALRASVARARDEARDRLRALRSLGDDLDPGRGRTARWVMGVTLGAFWICGPLIPSIPNVAWMPAWPYVGLVTSAISLVTLAMFSRIYMADMEASAINRRMARAAALAVSIGMLTDLVGLVLDVPRDDIERGQLVLLSVVSSQCVLMIEPRLLGLAVSYAIASVASVLVPVPTHFLTSICNSVLALTVFVIWFPKVRR